MIRKCNSRFWLKSRSWFRLKSASMFGSLFLPWSRSWHWNNSIGKSSSSPWE
jgi:hypothetical protein